MPKSNSKTSKDPQETLDFLRDLEQPDIWDFADPSDERFWEEFFQIEEILDTTDELDPPEFSITVQNQRTGELRTYSNVHLKSTNKKVVC